MWKKLLFVFAVAGLLAVTACSGGGSKNKAQVFPVQVDGKTDAFVASFLAFFPNKVEAHAGDTVEFHSNFTGEPHTVTLGKDVDDDFNLIAEACPNGGLADPACAEGPPAEFADRADAVDAKLPPLLPDLPSDPISQAAAQPCFLATGDAPTDNSACSAAQMQPQPDFDGTQTFYNSGWLQDQQVFTVKLASKIAPGTYNYFCLLHREGMSGTITVVDTATDVATPAEQTATGAQELADTVSKLQPEFDKLASLTAETAQAGAISQDAEEAEVNEFGAKDLTISTGGSVTWTVLGPHSIAFNAPESARPILKKDADGTVSFNEESLNPAPEGAPGQTPPDPNAPEPDPNAPPPDPNAPPTLIDGGTWDGQGFHSSGLILSFPGDPSFSSYKLTFSTAGTYTYICTIHTDMQGTITVQ
jgi:plastocyanin